MTRWIFIRHGQARSNAEGWYAGHRDAPLTALGREQAVALRPTLAELAPDRALSSDLLRAYQTARLALGTLEPSGQRKGPAAIPLGAQRGLRERDLGRWTGIQKPARTGLALPHQVLTSYRGRPPGGESLRDTARRAIAALLPWDGRDETIAVFAHGALIRALVGLIDGTPPDRIGHFHPTNCQVLPRTASLAALTP